MSVELPPNRLPIAVALLKKLRVPPLPSLRELNFTSFQSITNEPPDFFPRAGSTGCFDR